MKSLSSGEAKEVLGLIVPLIKIKNYKSQVPFPVDIFDAVQLITEIRNASPMENLSDVHVTFDKCVQKVCSAL
jgi:hypothetical protein